MTNITVWCSERERDVGFEPLRLWGKEKEKNMRKRASYLLLFAD